MTEVAEYETGDKKDHDGAYESEASSSAIDDKMVDVVLSDMSAPWDQTDGFYKRSISDPYRRMINTSGLDLRDHAGSMVSAESVILFCLW